MFLARASKFASNFLGRATKGAAFLGKHAGSIQKAAMSANAAVNNPAVQALASKSAVGQKILGGISKASNIVSNGVGALPQLAADARGVGQALSAPKRTLADLYKMST